MDNNNMRALRWYDSRPWKWVWNALAVMAYVPLSMMIGFITLSVFLSESECRGILRMMWSLIR